MRNYSQTLEGNQSTQKQTKISCLDIDSTEVLQIFSSFWSFYVINLKACDPNLKVFSCSFSEPYSLGVSDVGRSA